MSVSTAAADSPLRQAWERAEGKKPLRREVIERGGTSKLGLAGSPRVPVSRGAYTISRRTGMNNAREDVLEFVRSMAK